MNIIIDEALRFKNQVRETLIQYNLPFTGIRPTDTYHVYVLSHGILVGYMRSEMGWDYVSFPFYYYADLEVLKVMLDKIDNHYRNKACGIKLPLSNEQDYNAFVTIGFKEAGRLSYNPDGWTKYILQYGFEGVNHPSYPFTVYTSKDPLEEYEREIALHKIPESDKQEVVIAAFDDEDFLGGVYGYLQNGYLYIHLLSVEEQHRGQHLGSELMNQIETYAKDHGVYHAYVATCTFQAFEFYIKCGYKHDVTIPDKPKGYEEFIFSKQL